MKKMIKGSYPENDGWSWIYAIHCNLVRITPFLNPLIRAWLMPKRFEMADDGKLYRMMGIGLFGKIIPTGGIIVRRLTRSRMAAYTLRGTSLEAANQFFYRTCIFEALHMPFLVALVLLSCHRYSIGRADLAWENMFMNLVFNILPIMHHRHTRVRILHLLNRRRSC